MTPNFYWILQCNFEYFYEVEYAFNNCDYEAYIKAKLIPYPLDRQATLKELQPDYTTFFQAVLAVQDKQYIKTA